MKFNSLQTAILQALRDLPDSWTAVTSESATMEESLDLLVKSGLAEARLNLTVEMDGAVDALNVTLDITGGPHDLRRVTGPMIPAHWLDPSGRTIARTRFKTGDYHAARLTAYGMNAKQNIARSDFDKSVVVTLVMTQHGRPKYGIENWEVVSSQDEADSSRQQAEAVSRKEQETPSDEQKAVSDALSVPPDSPPVRWGLVIPIRRKSQDTSLFEAYNSFIERWPIDTELHERREAAAEAYVKSNPQITVADAREKLRKRIGKGLERVEMNEES